MKQPHVVVIGGGVAGTAAASTLLKRGYKVTIIEKANRLGGRVLSADINGLTAEMGAGFLTDGYKQTLAYLRETGLTDKLQTRRSRAFINHGGEQHALMSAATIFRNQTLSNGAKLRLLIEVTKLMPVWHRLQVLDATRAPDLLIRPSVTEHLQGKFGQELSDHLIGPALDGYCFWSPEQIAFSASMTFLLKLILLRRHTFILTGGLSQIPHNLAQGATTLRSHEVKIIEPTSAGSYRITVEGSSGRRLKADGIVCATTSSAVPDIFPYFSVEQRGFFTSVHYSSTAVVAYHITPSVALNNYAVAYPHGEGWPLSALTVATDLSPTASLIKLHASGSVGQKLCSKSDRIIEHTLSAGTGLDLQSARRTGAWRVQRWPEALPEFSPTHIANLRRFAAGGIEIPETRLVFAGDYLVGPFIEGALVSGVQAAERLAAQF